MFSFVITFEISNVEADLTSSVSGHCSARSLNAGTGRFFQGSPHHRLRRRGSTSVSGCCKAGKIWDNARALTELG